MLDSNAKYYRELIVWKRSMKLVVEIYKLIKCLPRDEMYALSNQIRRAAIAIPSNIAEGNGRTSAKEYVHFLSIARGSKYELETQLLICVGLGYLTINQISDAMTLSEEIGKMLNVLIKRLSE